MYEANFQCLNYFQIWFAWFTQLLKSYFKERKQSRNLYGIANGTPLWNTSSLKILETVVWQIPSFLLVISKFLIFKIGNPSIQVSTATMVHGARGKQRLKACRKDK